MKSSKPAIKTSMNLAALTVKGMLSVVLASFSPWGALDSHSQTVTKQRPNIIWIFTRIRQKTSMETLQRTFAFNGRNKYHPLNSSSLQLQRER